jgi:hypothetical protein
MRPYATLCRVKAECANLVQSELEQATQHMRELSHEGARAPPSLHVHATLEQAKSRHTFLDGHLLIWQAKMQFNRDVGSAVLEAYVPIAQHSTAQHRTAQHSTAEQSRAEQSRA